jgi:hypothetical protein
MQDRPTGASGVSVSSSTSDPLGLRADLSAVLQRARNVDGGWAYRPTKRSRIEPTCWALLALSQTNPQPPNLDVLARWPRRDNWLIDVAGAPPNHAFNAIAALTLLQSVSTGHHAETIVRSLIGSKGIALRPDPAITQDNSLQAWSWIDGTFSWVEPTAWGVLLLKQRLARGPYPDAAERIRVGEQLLNDRACRGGGWNYGSANVYGKDLLPYVPTTALALLALRDRANESVVVRGLEQLQRDVLSERSAVALSLAIICLRVYGRPTGVLEHHLTQLIVDRHLSAGYSDDLLGLGMALYALSDGPLKAFTLGSTV